MASTEKMSWRKFPVSLGELCIDTTLRCGQSFRWKKSTEGEVYSCAFNGQLISLRQDRTHLYYRTLQAGQRARDTVSTLKIEQSDGQNVQRAGDDKDDIEQFIKHYLNLEPNLQLLYEQWSKADGNFKNRAPKFTGIRILRQDAWEALIGFICSSNNNIARISQMMDKLCRHYGCLVGYINDEPFYDVPPPSALVKASVEGHLRELGFGYRAKYLYSTATKIFRESIEWLNDLRNPESPLLGQSSRSAGEFKPSGRDGYRKAHEQLLELQGVGPKVADCVCLMGLGWGEAVPVDTHVWQIAQRDYKFGKGRHRSLTKATYDAVADYFRTLWGKDAGWAHSVLFTADLRAFSDRLAARLEVDTKDSLRDLGPGSRASDSDKARIKIEIAPALPVHGEHEEEKPLVNMELNAVNKIGELNFQEKREHPTQSTTADTLHGARNLCDSVPGKRTKPPMTTEVMASTTKRKGNFKGPQNTSRTTDPDAKIGLRTTNISEKMPQELITAAAEVLVRDEIPPEISVKTENRSSNGESRIDLGQMSSVRAAKRQRQK